MKSFQEMMKDGDQFDEDLQGALDDPTGPKAKAILKAVLPILNFAGRKSSYGAVERNASVTKIFEISRRYGSPSVFLTVAPDDINNPTAFRLTFTIPPNDEKQHNEMSPEDLEEYLERMRSRGSVVGSGTVRMNYSARSRAAAEDPISYVAEYRRELIDVMTILLGIAPEMYSSGNIRSSKVRKTKFFKSRSKGLLGRALAAYGCNEDHAKGTLHYHLLLWTGLQPRILQRAAGIEDLCTAVEATLNSMYCADASRVQHTRAGLRTIMKEYGVRRAELPKVDVPLQLQNRTSDDSLRRKAMDDPTDANIDMFICETCRRRQFHRHTFTCRKGFFGESGCRLCKPSNLSEKTKPVQLHTIKEEAEEGREESSRVEATPIIDKAAVKSRIENPLTRPDRRMIVWELQRPKLDRILVPDLMSCRTPERQQMAAARATRDYNEAELVDQCLKEVLAEAELEPTDEFAVRFSAWFRSKPIEYKQQSMEMLNDKIENANGYMVEYVKLISMLTGAHNNALTLGSEEQSNSALFYVTNYVCKKKVELEQCLAVLASAKKHVDEYPSCAADSGTPQRTAQHMLTRTLNRCNLLMECSDYQVAAALLELPTEIVSESFAYINPGDCMSLIEQDKNFRKMVAHDDAEFAAENDALDARQEEEEAKMKDDDSVDSVGDSFIVPDDVSCEAPLSECGGSDRADEPIDELNPDGRRTEETDSRDYVFYEEMFASLGPAPFYQLPEDGGTSIPVPYPVHYKHRGKELGLMNRHEYAILVKVKILPSTKKEDTETWGRCKSRRYPLGEGHVLRATHNQLIKSKIPTLICCGKVPRYPGVLPQAASGKKKRAWSERANKFARYYLTLFRPETELYDNTSENTLSYNWPALQGWLAELKADRTPLSRFRLLALHNHVNTISTDYAAKKMLQQYRSQNRDTWSTDEQEGNKRRGLSYARQVFDDLQDGSLDDEETFREKNHRIPKSTMLDMEKQLQYCSDNLKGLLPGDQSRYGAAQMNGHRRDLPNRSESGSEDGQEPPVYADQKKYVDVRRALSEAATAADLPFGGETETTPAVSSSFGQTYGEDDRSNDTSSTARSRLKDSQKPAFDLVMSMLETGTCTIAPNRNVLLITGFAGTGKSFLIAAIKEGAKEKGRPAVCLAYNGIAAVNIGGKTISSAVHQVYDKLEDERKTGESLQSIPPLDDSQLSKLVAELQLDDSPILIIDEISTVSPIVLATIDSRLRQATDSEEPFGGIPVVLLGDFSQLPPVCGTSLTEGAMQAEVQGRRFKAQMERLQQQLDRSLNRGPGRKRRKVVQEQHGKYAPHSPFRRGTELIKQAVWIELTEQMRSRNDASHLAVQRKFWAYQPVTVQDLQNYKILAEDDFVQKDRGWHKAPVLVTTNLERYQLIDSLCRRYAAIEGKRIYRWPSKHKQWVQAPCSIYEEDAISENACFWEYFIEGCECYITKNINAALRLANGTRAVYHSITPRDEEQEAEIRDKTAASSGIGSVISLSKPPLSVNIQLKDEETSPAVIAKWSKYSLEAGKIVIPITSKDSTYAKYKQTIVGGNGDRYAPSKVSIKQVIPLEPSLTTTVHKSQGRTMDAVILALSHRKLAICNLRYEALYVAMSRVRKAADIRLLLHGEDPWQSVSYISTLQPPPSLAAFFAGHDRGRAEGSTEWNADRAYESYKLNTAR
jgi:hypothetical protein